MRVYGKLSRGFMLMCKSELCRHVATFNFATGHAYRWIYDSKVSLCSDNVMKFCRPMTTFPARHGCFFHVGLTYIEQIGF